MEGFVQAVVAFVADHPGWVFAVMFAVSFGESLAIVSLAFPGTAVLLATGALVPGDPALLWPLLGGAMLGAALGDGASYWLGRHFGGDVERLWPLSRHPELVARGVAIFARHGGKAVFIGRFFGPMRALVPLAAGILRMAPIRFWVANIASVVIWAPAILLPGAMVGESITRFARGERFLPIIVVVIVALVIVVVWRVSSWLRR